MRHSDELYLVIANHGARLSCMFAAAPRENEPIKTNLKLALAVLAGVSIGAAGGRTIHGQQLKTPPAYIISEADAITDLAAIKQYGEKVPGTLAPFDGHYHFMVGGGKTKSLDGQAPQGIVVIAFESAEQARLV